MRDWLVVSKSPPLAFRRPSIGLIVDVVAAHRKVAKREILSGAQVRYAVEARRLVCFLCVDVARRQPRRVASALNACEKTVRIGVNAVQTKIKADPNFAREVQNLSALVAFPEGERA